MIEEAIMAVANEERKQEKEKGTEEAVQKKFEERVEEAKKRHQHAVEALDLDALKKVLQLDQPFESNDPLYQVRKSLVFGAVSERKASETERLANLDHDPKASLTHQALKVLPVNVVMRPSQVVFLEHYETLSQALETLGMAGILSAPVRKDNEIIGMVDLGDIVAEVLHTLRKRARADQVERLFEKTTMEDILFGNESLDIPKNASKWSPLNHNDTLGTALRLMGTGTHRIPILSSSKLNGILSQSDICRVIAEFPHLLEGTYTTSSGQTVNLRQLPVGEIPAVKKTAQIVKIKSSCPTWLALETLNSQRVSALAVVDDPLSRTPKIVGSFSVNHIKALSLDTFHYLLLPVEKYLSLITPDPSEWVNRCGVDYPLIEIIKKLATSSISGGSHRVWLTDEDGTLLGLLSLTDLLHFLFTL